MLGWTRGAVRRAAALPLQPQRRACGGSPFASIVEEVKQERERRVADALAAYPRVAEVMGGVKGTDDLSHVVRALRGVPVRDLPQSPMDLLACFGTAIDFTDLQCVQLGVWLTQDGRVGPAELAAFSDAFAAMPNASYRTLSLLCVTCARYGDVERAVAYYHRLLHLTPRWLRRNVKWEGVLTKLLAAVGWSGEAYDHVVAAALDSQEPAVLNALVLSAAYAGQRSQFDALVERGAAHGKYQPTSADGVYHRVMLLLASGSGDADERALLDCLADLQAKCGREDVRARYPKLQRNINRPSGIHRAVKKRCHFLLAKGADVAAAGTSAPAAASASPTPAPSSSGEPRAPTPSSTADASGVADEDEGSDGPHEAASPSVTLCYDYKLGKCRNARCEKVHELVRCPAGAACTLPRCPYVHPEEIAWRWAREGAPRAECIPAVREEAATTLAATDTTPSGSVGNEADAASEPSASHLHHHRDHTPTPPTTDAACNRGGDVDIDAGETLPVADVAAARAPQAPGRHAIPPPPPLKDGGSPRGDARDGGARDAERGDGGLPPPPQQQRRRVKKRAQQNGTPKVTYMRLPSRGQQGTPYVERVVEGWKTLSAGGAGTEISEHDRENMKRMRVLLSKLHDLDEQRIKAQRPASERHREAARARRVPPQELLATYTRPPLVPTEGAARPRSAAERLLEACEADPGTDGAPKKTPAPPPLPSFAAERNAASSASLLSVLQGHAAGAPPPPPPLPKPKPKTGRGAAQRAHQREAGETSWYDAITRIMS